MGCNGCSLHTTYYVLSEQSLNTFLNNSEYLIYRKINLFKGESGLENYRILVGVSDRTDRQFSYKIEKVVINDCFNIHGIGNSDIALLRTDRKIDFLKRNDSFIINSICLPKGDPIDFKVFFSGWGHYTEGMDGSGGESPKILKRTVMKLTSLEECRTKLLVLSDGLTYTSIDNLCIENSNSTACYVRPSNTSQTYLDND